MATSKNTFAPQTFAANTFASGTFRGLGVTPPPVVTPVTVGVRNPESWSTDDFYPPLPSRGNIARTRPSVLRLFSVPCVPVQGNIATGSPDTIGSLASVQPMPMQGNAVSQQANEADLREKRQTIIARRAVQQQLIVGV